MSGLTNIRIGFSQPKNVGFVSRAIMALQRFGAKLRGKEWQDPRSVPSHAFVLCNIGDDEMVAGADDNGFQMQTRARFEQTNIIVDEPALKASLDGAAETVIKMLDDPYGYVSLVWEVVNSVLRWCGLRLSNPFSKRSQPYCSNACVRVLQAAGYQGAEKLDPTSTWPVDLKVFLDG